MVEQGILPVSKSEKLIPQVEKYKLATRLLDRPYRDVVIYNIIFNDIKDIGNDKKLDDQLTNSLDKMIEWFRKKYSL